jgi:hypothetical protein
MQVPTRQLPAVTGGAEDIVVIIPVFKNQQAPTQADLFGDPQAAEPSGAASTQANDEDIVWHAADLAALAERFLRSCALLDDPAVPRIKKVRLLIDLLPDYVLQEDGKTRVWSIDTIFRALPIVRMFKRMLLDVKTDVADRIEILKRVSTDPNKVPRGYLTAELYWLHALLIEDLGRLGDPNAPLQDKVHMAGWVFTEPYLEGQPFSFNNAQRLLQIKMPEADVRPALSQIMQRLTDQSIARKVKAPQLRQGH